MGVELSEKLDIPGLTFDSAGFPGDISYSRLHVQLAETVKHLCMHIDGFYVSLLNSSTVEDFRRTRKEILPAYFRTNIALSNILLADLNPVDISALNREALTDVSNEFMSKGKDYLGDEAYKEVDFSISTLKRSQKWIPRIVATSPSDKTEDAKLVKEYFYHSLWANLHLECLIRLIRKKETINKDILFELLDGLRVSVMIYACVRSALDLRGINDTRYSEKLEVEWDEEDEALANAL